MAKSGKDACAECSVHGAVVLCFQRAVPTFSVGFEFRGRTLASHIIISGLQMCAGFWSICTQLSKTARYMQPFRPKGAF